MGTEESDQLPEEGPGSQVPDDDGDKSARDSAEENPGTPGSDEGQSTGNPDAAGSEESEEG